MLTSIFAVSLTKFFHLNCKVIILLHKTSCSLNFIYIISCKNTLNYLYHIFKLKRNLYFSLKEKRVSDFYKNYHLNQLF